MVSLPAESKIPDYIYVFLVLDAFFPELPEFVPVRVIGRIQPGICPGEHLRAQGLRVVVGDIQPHVRGEFSVLPGILVRARDDHVASAAQQRLEHHFPRLLLAVIHFPRL